MATTGERLLELERRLWAGDAEYFGQHLDDACLVALPRLSGVRRREEIVAGMQARRLRWLQLDLTLRGCIEPAPGVALLTYRAAAVRPDGKPYAALVSSGYVDRGGTWKLVFHQQSPLE
ncbi:MAG: hypothetical protein IT561_09685 [Alphaproteobacteria bacterium]|nr:hypothetical protein [Alphaproteobacteria bacterium]